MSILLKAENQIALRRQAAEDAAQRRYQRALEDADFCRAEKAYRALLPKRAKARATGTWTEAHRQAFAAAESARTAALTKLKLTDADFAPDFGCARCGDTGYVSGARCDCLKRELTLLTAQQYGFNAAKLPAFDTENNAYLEAHRQLKEAHGNLARYCEIFPETSALTTVLTGGAGTGKTYLAGCMVRCLLEKGYAAVVISSFKLNRVFARAHTDFTGEGLAELENLIHCDLLAVDDLGTENVLKNVTADYLLALVGERLALGKHLLITTNLAMDQIRDRYGERLFSRLFRFDACNMIALNGGDLRMSKRKSN